MSIIESFRPKDIYEKILLQREIDGKNFYKKFNHDFININCPVCGDSGNYVFNKWEYNHNQCKKCNTIYCNPRPNDDLLSLYYNEFEAPKMWTELLLATDKERKMLQYEPRIKKIISVMKNKTMGKAVDVGAGSGAFSLALKKSEVFEDVIAVDLSEVCVKECKNQGLNAFHGSIKDLKNDFASLICMNDVIEHLFNPIDFLKDCYRALKVGGYISIATPNGQGFDFKILKDKTKNITPPEHLTYFNPYSLKLLLENIGFKNVAVSTPGILDVEIIHKETQNGCSLNENNEWLGFLFEQNEEILKNFQLFLAENQLSSHMLVIAEK